MSLYDHLLFIVFAAIASYVQNLTGFAFGLILLGFVGLAHNAPLAEVTNAVSILSILNAALLFQKSVPPLDRPSFMPTLVTSLMGVGVGVWLLNWLSDNVILWLRMVLGITIAVAAVLLVVQAKPLARRSPRYVFGVFGVISGILGGLFSTAGPPLVFHFYRQPIDPVQVRASLILIFAANAVLRLALQFGAGRVGADGLWMSLEAAPVVILLTVLAVHRPHRWSIRAVQVCVAILLGVVAVALFVPAAQKGIHG